MLIILVTVVYYHYFIMDNITLPSDGSISQAEKAQKLKDAITTLQQAVADSPAAANQLLKVLSNSAKLSPSNWSLTTNAAYYSPKYGQAVALILSKLLERPTQNLSIDRAAFPGRSKGTILMLINQGWMWLRDNGTEEDKKKYTELRKQVTLHKTQAGIQLQWVKEEGDVITVDALISMSSYEDAGQVVGRQAWEKGLEDWMETAGENEVFERKRIVITAEKKAWVKMLVESVKGFHIIELEENRVKLIYNTTVEGLQ